MLCTRTAAPRLNIADDRLDRLFAAENIELTNRFESVAAATATAHLLAHLLAGAAAADLGLDDRGCEPLEHRCGRPRDDRCLAAGVLTENDIAALRSTADAWNLPTPRLDALHQTYIDTLQPATRATIEDALRARLALVSEPSNRRV